MTGDLMNLTTFLKHIGNDNSGATAVEYGLIVSLIVIAMIGALQGVAQATIETWSEVETASVAAMNGS
ncbi:Flp family type IVb pilin [Qipengyuania sp. ASV99]|uniref:Flp family type IVb pilin n=1 Tax=Qipengyuania sp. ASV99 TaxID=3399681 RepID=UPI003A4C6933